jgi:hypothetical protein
MKDPSVLDSDKATASQQLVERFVIDDDLARKWQTKIDRNE